ncbi:MAG: hypothetical protein P1T08_13515 [Acidimicrobiia bacterium]|nr:hypothetical protein [Acidimicrobiia bacterium]
MIVLGAGASRGASTSEGKLCQPPLNADFFTQLQRIATSKHEDKVAAIVKDIVGLFGPNFSLTMEEYFTQLESMALMSRMAASKDRNFSPAEIREKRTRLMAALAAVLEVSTDVSKKASAVCDHHAAIVNRLQPQDTIISFNYDCVADHALRRGGNGKWSAKYGYGFSKPGRIVGHDNWDAADPPKKVQGTINLLKLHGSLNWQLPPANDAETGPIRLKQRLYEQNGIPKFTIIPPEFIKQIDADPNFEALWRNAERAIRGAEVIALVGFSFTPTDLHVESLFRIALAKSPLKTLVIANPSPTDRRRIRSVFARPLERGCVVRQYDYLSDFAKYVATNPF